MGKLYTFDKKLLTDTSEIRIGGKIYPVDDRKKTVEKIMSLAEGDIPQSRLTYETLCLSIGKKAADEIEEMNMPYKAYQSLFELIISAITGEEPARFQEESK